MRYLIGIGTYMGFDDSIGLRIVEAVSAEGLDDDFRAVEIGGNLIDLLHYLDHRSASVLIVDSARMGSEPGEYAFFTPEQVVSHKELAGFSTHEGDLLKVLELAQSLGTAVPPVTIMGIEPADTRAEAGLSPELRERLGEYVAAAVSFIEA